jgi:lambda family phage portal protein
MIFDRAHRTRIVKLLRRSFGFDASGGGDRWPLSSQLWSPVSQALAAAGPISHRADWLAANSPSAASYVECWQSSLGTEPLARSSHPDQSMRKLIETSWRRFSTRCDAEGAGDLVGFLVKAIRTLVISGEAFVLMQVRDGRLKLRLISTEQVARAWTRVLENGNRVFAGVEVDGAGCVVGFWIYPQQLDLPWASSMMPERIDAADVLHIFKQNFPGAVRGISWMVPISTRLLELDRLEDALLARANTSALFSGFVRDLDNSSGFAADVHMNRVGRPEISMEPGTMRILPPGCDVVFPQNIPDVNGINDFVKHLLRSIASGGGVPASLMTGDLSDVNYSSSRLGLEQFKRAVARIQQSHLVAQFLQPVWERFITLEILSGRISADDFEDSAEDYFEVDFRWPAWASLDPEKDINADVTALQNNLRSRAEIIAARGRDIADVDAEIAADPLPKPQQQTTGEKSPVGKQVPENADA